MDELEAARFRIYALEDGAIRAQALSFSLRLGLFDRLEEEPLTLLQMEKELRLAPRVLPALVAFLSSQGLVARDALGAFRNTAASSTFLVRSSPRYVGGRGLLFSGFHDAIGHLPESLASGRPMAAEGLRRMFETFGNEDQRWFADGMFSNAAHGARWLIERVDFSLFGRILDVGGSTGGYTIPILRVHPLMKATIFDLEAVRAIALERVAVAGLGDRIGFVAGSFFEDELPPGHDVILLSSILHDWDEAECAAILARCHRALLPGGTIVVTEPMLADDATGPDHPAVSGLTMAVLGGENRTRARIAAMLEAARFEAPWMSELGPQNSVVTAKKRQT